MKLGNDSRAALWTWLNIGVILASAASVFFPAIRHAGGFIAANAALMAIYLVVLIRRLRAQGLGDLTPHEIYSQAKQGRRLPKDPLQTAAAIALFVSTIYASTPGG